MTETRFERRERRDREMDEFLRSKPEPMATAAEVLEVACRACGAEAGAACDFGRLKFSLLGLAFPGLHMFHSRRYADRSGDPR